MRICGDFFTRYVSGTDEIPFADFLGRAGLAIRDTGQRRAAFGFAINREGNGPPRWGRWNRIARPSKPAERRRYSGCAGWRGSSAFAGTMVARSSAGGTRHGEGAAGRRGNGILLCPWQAIGRDLSGHGDAGPDRKTASHSRWYLARRHRPFPMIRTAIVAVFLTLYTLVLGPPLILYHARDAVGESDVLGRSEGRGLHHCAAGMRVRVEGLENIPRGSVHVCRQSHQQCGCRRNRGGHSPAPRYFRQEDRFLIFPSSGLAFRLAKFVPVDRGNREAALASVKQGGRVHQDRFIVSGLSGGNPQSRRPPSALQERLLRHGH